MIISIAEYMCATFLSKSSTHTQTQKLNPKPKNTYTQTQNPNLKNFLGTNVSLPLN